MRNTIWMIYEKGETDPDMAHYYKTQRAALKRIRDLERVMGMQMVGPIPYHAGAPAALAECAIEMPKRRVKRVKRL